jgi:hypothetical protein
LLEETRERRERQEKKREWQWIILKYIAFAYEDSITKCTESCWIMGEEGDRERVSNRWG